MSLSAASFSKMLPNEDDQLWHSEGAGNGNYVNETKTDNVGRSYT